MCFHSRESPYNNAPVKCHIVGDIDALSHLIRTRPATELLVSSPSEVSRTLASLATVNPYFVATTGDPGLGDWRPASRLYDEADALAEVVGHVGARISSTEYRVAASTLFLGYAARLWSLVLGGAVRDRRLLDLDPAELLWLDDHGQIRLHVREPRGWEGADLVDLVRAMVLDRHLEPMVDSIRSAEPMSERLLWGNAASALIGAARVLDGDTRTDAITVTETILRDPRLTDTVDREGAGYRRRSCCLFYRTPVSGYCGDCALTGPSESVHHQGDESV